MKEIGGYFGMECGRSKPYHSDGVCVNSGSNALRLIIRMLGIRKIWVPYYTCSVVYRAVVSEGCEVGQYELDYNMMPAQDFGVDDFILYNNYFGVCGCNVKKMSARYPNLIVDNAQAFYSREIGRAAFYSPRKFFGLPDGGIAVFRDKKTASCTELEFGRSITRTGHLLKRIDIDASAGYSDFRAAEESLSEEPPMAMSKLTASLMGNCDYALAKERRLANFIYLNECLPTTFPFALADDDVPMVNPYITDNPGLRARLINDKIFVASYWPQIKNCDSLRERILPLPIDQRYDIEDMKRIVEAVKNG